MAYGIALRVWGEFASFNRPEMKVERVSYDVMTPSAARGILEAIYWKPQMRWVIDRIRVLKPIRFTHVRRNEVKDKIPVKGASGVGSAMQGREMAFGVRVGHEKQRQQRAAMILRDVDYVIEAHVEAGGDEQGTTCPIAKHLEMFKRRARKGQYFHHPYLGTREFPASFELLEQIPAVADAMNGRRDLGWMLHDLVFVPDDKGPIVESSEGRRVAAEPRFFRAEMVDGVVDVPPLAQGRG